VRTILVAALTGLALSACASGQDAQQAVLDCQSVGIAPSDPDYEVCQQAYVAQKREGQLSTSYRTTAEVVRSQYRRNTER
jgi:hypothetical protein